MVRWGGLPFACTTDRPADYLASYASTYLREEVQQEGFARNIATFARFLESASFSQGAVLNMAAVACDCGIPCCRDWPPSFERTLPVPQLPHQSWTWRNRRARLVHDTFGVH